MLRIITPPSSVKGFARRPCRARGQSSAIRAAAEALGIKPSTLLSRVKEGRYCEQFGFAVEWPVPKVEPPAAPADPIEMLRLKDRLKLEVAARETFVPPCPNIFGIY